MNFALFLVLNAVLLLRPEELFPELAGARLYLITIVLCIATSLPDLQRRLTTDALRRQPIGVCVLGLWAAGFLSCLCFQWRPEDALDFAGEFGKVVLYYFLLAAVVNTPGRFRGLVAWLVVCITASAALATLDYHEVLDFQGIEHAKQTDVDPETGQQVILLRMCSSGIFADPNDLCLALNLGMLGCVYLALSGAGAARVGWLVPIALLAYALTLTHSRGGLLGLLAGVGGWLFARYGGKRAIPLGVVAIVGLLAAIGGRQASIGGGGTAHSRLMYWAMGLSDLFRMPLYLVPGLGIGYFPEQFGQVAHNSFVSAYVETGLLGGGCFLAAFYIAGRVIERANRVGALSDWAAATRPFAFAAVAAYAGGAYSLSREYVLPTYVTLGLTTAYIDLSGTRFPTWDELSAAWFKRMAFLSVVGLALLKVLTQGLGMFGV